MTHDLRQLVQTAMTAKGPAQVRAAGRLMTLLEDDPTRLPEVMLAEAAIEGDEQRLPVVMVLGVTGAPGSGKSTLTDALVAEYRHRHPDRRVGVIAVDPSSPFTGGAVLGDRVRMMRHATDPMVFVRSMASRGHLGGLALGVRGVVRVMQLIGCHLVAIETVGVGQSEVEVASVADLTMIVFAPGQGDSIQLLKAGLMEIGDFFVVNKADKPGAAELHHQLLATLKLGAVDAAEAPGHHLDSGPGAAAADAGPELGLMRRLAADPAAGRIEPQVHLVSAADRTGLSELVRSLEEQAVRFAPAWIEHRRQDVGQEVRQAVLEAVRRRMEATLGHNGTLAREMQRVLAGEVSVSQLVQELLERAARSDAP